MADDLDLARERVRQQRARDVAGVGKAAKLNTTAEERLGLVHQRGDRVIDLVTGEEGIVEGSYREAVIVPNTDG